MQRVIMKEILLLEQVVQRVSSSLHLPRFILQMPEILELYFAEREMLFHYLMTINLKMIHRESVFKEQEVTS